MCSIAGSENFYTTKYMNLMMKHRAPDDEGYMGDEKFILGMGRLAIVDLKSGGLCPYVEDGGVLVFNGEIYNYKEIRKELQKRGRVFRTKSDTEVLFKAYKEWGVRCLDKLNGMFAFAIYDGRKVFFARDIAGEKPLYYRENSFRFASEAKALNWGCEELPPAHYGIYDFKTVKIKRYWELKKREIKPEEAEEELEWMIGDSIKLRTATEVPYALYYSGGIDSSLIATYHDFPYKFTYKDRDYKKEYLKNFKKILWHLDYPVNSFSPFGLWKLAEMASKKVKVVVSGEGADELFGGYVRYIAPHFNYNAQGAFPSYKTMFIPSESVQSAGWRDFNGNMQELLRMGDRMASAFGIENRCPFLDKRIIEFAYSLPDNLKINNLETKVILRRILEKRNPSYKHIEKKGLFIPVNRWIGSAETFSKVDYLKMQNSVWKKLVS